jgi:hypothetical protein
MDALLKKSKKPHIEVIDINTGGDNEEPSLHFEVNDAFLDMIKEEKGIDRVSQEQLSSYVNDLITKCANQTDGYNYNKMLEPVEDE